MKCSNCKFWEYKQDAIGTCSCDKFKLGYQFMFQEIKPDEVWVEYDEGWGFYTGKDFGCVHYEAM